MEIEKIKKNMHHIILPIALMLLSKFNEKYYLQEGHFGEGAQL